MNVRLPAHPAVALALLGLAAMAVESVEAWGPPELVLSPRLAAFAVIGCCVAAVALAADPAWSFSAALGASMFSGHWAALGLPVPADRLLLVVGVAGLILRAPLELPERQRVRFVHFAVVAAALFAVVSAYAVGSFTSRQGSFALLDRYGLIPFLSFLLAPIVFNTQRRQTILLGVLTICGAYLSLTALAEATGAHALVWPSYIVDPNVGIHANRARGPFVEAGALGVALWGCGVAALVLASSPPRRWVRPAGFVVAILCVLGVLFSLTRADWLAASVAGVITLVVARELHRFVVPAIVCCVLVVGGALAVVPDLSQKASAREQTQSPIWDRLNSDAAALRMVEAKPLLGFGWDSFGDKSAPYYRITANYPLTSVAELHNVFLSNAAELGLVGASIWLAALVAAVGAPIVRAPPPGTRAWRTGLLAIAVMWLVAANFSPLAAVFPNLLLWTWAGVLWSRRVAQPEPRALVGLESPGAGSPLRPVGASRAVRDPTAPALPAPVWLQPTTLEGVPAVAAHAPKRTRLMGIELDRLDEAGTIETVLDGLRRDVGGWICLTDLRVLRQCSLTPHLRALVAQADVVVAADEALVWLSRLAGTPLPACVTASSLIETLPAAAAEARASVCLLGGDPVATTKVADHLSTANPGLAIAGVLCLPHRSERDEEELAVLENQLEDAQPDVVFVGLGFPKQGHLIQRLRTVLPRAWFVSCGIDFDFVSRELVPAPRWAQQAGLEWIQHVAQQPRRLLGRYGAAGLPFLGEVAARALASRIRNERRRESRPRDPQDHM
ncbi:MAG: putative inorganic carbon ((-)) transporter [Solirubrobacteraceae bacterium]